MAFILSRLFSIILRLLQLACAVIVTGIVADAIDGARKAGVYAGDRFIFTIVVSTLSMFIALILLIPFAATFTVFPVDLIVFILWIAAFGVLADFIAPMNCSWAWSFNATSANICERWKAALAFSFISAMLWLFSALLAIWVVWRHRTGYSEHRRRWWRSGYT